MTKNSLPKTEFLKNKTFVEAHNRLIESADFQRALDVSRLQYMRSLNGVAPSITDPQERTNPSNSTISSMMFQRIQGMEDFCAMLMNLAEPYPQPPQGHAPDNLIEIPGKGRPRN